MAKQCIGLDIGSSSVKAVQLRRKGAPSASRMVIIQSGAATSLRVRLDAPDGAKGRSLPNL